MTPDDRAEPPDQPKTTQIAAVPQWAIELTQAMKSGIAEVRADIGLVSNDVGLLKQRVSIIESLRVEDEARAVKYSGGIRNLSQSDLAMEAKLGLALGQLSEEKAKREALEKAAVSKEDVAAVVGEATALQTTALVNKISENKKLQVVGGMILTLALGWLGRMATAPAAPVPAPVVQLAPITIYADAGVPR